MSVAPKSRDFAAVREREYRWAPDRIFLNAASYGPMPECGRAAIEDFDRRRQRAELTDADFMDAVVKARASAARLIGAAAAEIALVPNTSVGINLAAHIAAERAGDCRTIVLCDREFPANIYPWLALGRRGFEIRIVPTQENGQPDEDALADALAAPNVGAFAISFVQFANGYRADLQRFGELCHARNILFVVDAIQGLGAVPLSVRDHHIDVLACGAQKWLCSPWGIGFAYIRAELGSAVEPYLPGWLSFTASSDVTNLVEYRYELRTDAQRFEVGSLPFQSCVAFSAVADLLLELGIDRISSHIRALQDHIVAWSLLRPDVAITNDLRPQARSGILCVRPRNPAAAHAALLAAGVTCSLREGAIRLAPHFYNTEAEIGRVIDVLEHVLS